ncbi:MAG: FKBP-type peptidyl-prolyl cis-trans isomerase [Bacteroidales bacterium]|nr:FKBP-type peptidyl-prolyl cis-trans isomerase [Bacteroidales bacterium]
MNKSRISFHLLYAVIILLISPVLFTSCLKDDSDYEKQVKIDDRIINTYLTNHNIQAQKHYSGIYYRKIKENITATSLTRYNVVSFYYTIYRLDEGMYYITSQQPIQSISKANGDKPLQFCLLSNTMVPQGLDYGISLMKVGEIFEFYIPSYLAYGSYGCSLFPANSNFVVVVEVVGVDTETGVEHNQLDSIQNYANIKYPNHQKLESGLFFIDSLPGTGENPGTQSRVEVDFTRKYLDDSIIKSVIGSSFYLDNLQAVKGLEEGLKLMKEGGSAIMIMPSKIGFGESLCIVPQKARKELLEDKLISAEVEPYSILKYVVKLRKAN